MKLFLFKHVLFTAMDFEKISSKSFPKLFNVVWIELMQYLC